MSPGATRALDPDERRVVDDADPPRRSAAVLVALPSVLWLVGFAVPSASGGQVILAAALALVLACATTPVLGYWYAVLAWDEWREGAGVRRATVVGLVTCAVAGTMVLSPAGLPLLAHHLD